MPIAFVDVVFEGVSRSSPLDTGSVDDVNGHTDDAASACLDLKLMSKIIVPMLIAVEGEIVLVHAESDG